MKAEIRKITTSRERYILNDFVQSATSCWYKFIATWQAVNFKNLLLLIFLTCLIYNKTAENLPHFHLANAPYRTNRSVSGWIYLIESGIRTMDFFIWIEKWHFKKQDWETTIQQLIQLSHIYRQKINFVKLHNFYFSFKVWKCLLLLEILLTERENCSGST